MGKRLVILIGKFVSFISQILHVGAGATWPGEIALRLDPNILSKIAPKNCILVAGTNGKTTTTLMIKHILGKNAVTNASGANLLNGIVSSIITSPPAEWGIFEVDENSLPSVLSYMSSRAKRGDLNGIASSKTPRNDILVLLNLFRDQLDRYGEVDTIAEKWKKALTGFSGQLIVNADDPLIASLGNKKSLFFGLEDVQLFQKVREHAMDSQFCPKCQIRLTYAGTFYSHIGHWSCPGCHFSRPKPHITTADYPLMGTYNRYNTLAAVAVAKVLGIEANLTGFHPAFGRQEAIGDIKIFLSKNPASFNESLRTGLELHAKNILLALNDRIPDGRDVSWIWDVDFEMIPKNISVFITGDRAQDLAVRLKYAEIPATIVLEIPKVPNLVILATYSAMLEIRKQLTGKKIL